MAGELPSKVCARCGRAFAWRRKWKAVWPQVKYCSERCRRSRGDATRPLVTASILARLRRSRGTICPSEVARDVWPDAWRDHMNDTRAVARQLAAEERLVWLQGGKPVDPGAARGPIRLGRGPRFEA